jgi:8-oxo-dGTP pyrophosphatase MutT (NUDIX family)
LVRHSYGDRTLWNIPGGGYNPKKESSLDAAVREAQEELSIALKNPRIIGTYATNSEGKQDSVTIVKDIVEKSTPKWRDEILEVRWVSSSSIQNGDDIARVVKYAVALVESK